MPKQDLEFRTPLMNAAGSCGFAPDPHAPVEWDAFGAFITNPISLRPRRAAEFPAFIEYPGGVLLHTGLPNPGFRAVLGRYARAWSQAPLPIIVCLMADRPEETRQMVLALEGRENIMAIELSFAAQLADDLILLAVELSSGEVPIIVSLPPEQLLRLGPQVDELGAAAISISPARGALRRGEEHVSGRLFGPSLFPHSLELVRSACKLGLAAIGSGGITEAAGVDSMLVAGALAVQIDLALWRPPGKEKSPVN